MSRLQQTDFVQPRVLTEMMEHRDAFLREGVPFDFIQAQIAQARRRRNQEMGEAVLGLVRAVRKWVSPPRQRGQRVSPA
ncbi:MAG TPA: hypothetical protein VMM15_18220 [Bradyrhizobium sp.]|nr:hypothetical protein [Bradyrhizobium sp.]